MIVNSSQSKLWAFSQACPTATQISTMLVSVSSQRTTTSKTKPKSEMIVLHWKWAHPNLKRHSSLSKSKEKTFILSLIQSKSSKAEIMLYNQHTFLPSAVASLVLYVMQSVLERTCLIQKVTDISLTRSRSSGNASLRRRRRQPTQNKS